MNEQEAKDLILDYVYGELDRAKEARLHEHLVGCASCQQAVKATQQIRRAYRQVPALAPPTGAAAKALVIARGRTPATEAVAASTAASTAAAQDKIVRLPRRRFMFHPAWGVAAVLIVVLTVLVALPSLQDVERDMQKGGIQRTPPPAAEGDATVYGSTAEPIITREKNKESLSLARRNRAHGMGEAKDAAVRDMATLEDGALPAAKPDAPVSVTAQAGRMKKVAAQALAEAEEAKASEADRGTQAPRAAVKIEADQEVQYGDGVKREGGGAAPARTRTGRLADGTSQRTVARAPGAAAAERPAALNLRKITPRGLARERLKPADQDAPSPTPASAKPRAPAEPQRLQPRPTPLADKAKAGVEKKRLQADSGEFRKEATKKAGAGQKGRTPVAAAGGMGVAPGAMPTGGRTMPGEAAAKQERARRANRAGFAPDESRDAERETDALEAGSALGRVQAAHERKQAQVQAKAGKSIADEKTKALADDGRSRLQLAQAAYVERQYEEALKHLGPLSAKAEVESAAGLALRVRCLLALERFAEARAALKTLTVVDEKQAAALQKVLVGAEAETLKKATQEKKVKPSAFSTDPYDAD